MNFNKGLNYVNLPYIYSIVKIIGIIQSSVMEKTLAITTPLPKDSPSKPSTATLPTANASNASEGLEETKERTRGLKRSASGYFKDGYAMPYSQSNVNALML